MVPVVILVQRDVRDLMYGVAGTFLRFSVSTTKAAPNQSRGFNTNTIRHYILITWLNLSAYLLQHHFNYRTMPFRVILSH